MPYPYSPLRLRDFAGAILPKWLAVLAIPNRDFVVIGLPDPLLLMRRQRVLSSADRGRVDAALAR